jgi:hypothetical protein
MEDISRALFDWENAGSGCWKNASNGAGGEKKAAGDERERRRI